VLQQALQPLRSEADPVFGHNEEEVRERLKEVCGQILEEQLDGWYRVSSSWPSRRDLDAFDRWFEWSFHSVVVDLCDDPPLREELCPPRVPRLAGVGDGLNYWTVRGSSPTLTASPAQKSRSRRCRLFPPGRGH